MESRRGADAEIEDQSLVSFLPLDVTSEDSVNTAMSHIDNMMQYGEDEEPKVSAFLVDLADQQIPKDMDEGTSAIRNGDRRLWTAGDFADE